MMIIKMTKAFGKLCKSSKSNNTTLAVPILRMEWIIFGTLVGVFGIEIIHDVMVKADFRGKVVVYIPVLFLNAFLNILLWIHVYKDKPMYGKIWGLITIIACFGFSASIPAISVAFPYYQTQILIIFWSIVLICYKCFAVVTIVFYPEQVEQEQTTDMEFQPVLCIDLDLADNEFQLDDLKL